MVTAWPGCLREGYLWVNGLTSAPVGIRTALSKDFISSCKKLISQRWILHEFGSVSINHVVFGNLIPHLLIKFFHSKAQFHTLQGVTLYQDLPSTNVIFKIFSFFLLVELLRMIICIIANFELSRVKIGQKRVFSMEQDDFIIFSLTSCWGMVLSLLGCRGCGISVITSGGI